MPRPSWHTPPLLQRASVVVLHTATSSSHRSPARGKAWQSMAGPRVTSPPRWRAPHGTNNHLPSSATLSAERAGRRDALTRVAGRTRAGVAVRPVQAGGVVEARVGQALVHVQLAQLPCTTHTDSQRQTNLSLRGLGAPRQRSGPLTRQCCATGSPVDWQWLPNGNGQWSHSPTKPSGQVQLKAATPSTQLPPLRHGEDQHSSQLVWQSAPVYPSMQ